MMKSTTRLYAWRRVKSAASAKILAVGLLVSVSLSANAQRDIFNWEFSGSFAAVNSGDFELPEEPSLFAAGGRLQLNLGNAWQVGLHAGQFNFGESPQLERSYAGLSLAYFWDNGVLLNKRAFITPYHLIEGGFFGQAVVEDAANAKVTEQSSAVGFENGLKFRFGDRMTFHVAHAVYRELDNAGFEETVGNDGLSLWKAGLSYHFGAKKVGYSGPVFDASARFEKSRFAGTDIRPMISLPGTEPDPADTVRPKDIYLPMPKSTGPEMISGVDTIINAYLDTTYTTRMDTIVRTMIDTNYATSIDTAFVFRVDSVRGNVLDTNFTNVIDTVFTTRSDTAFAVRMDTMFTVRPDTVYRPWSRPAKTEDMRDRPDNVQEGKLYPVQDQDQSDETYKELRNRIAYLEGLVEGMSRRDTIVAIREERREKEPQREERQESELIEKRAEPQEKEKKKESRPKDTFDDEKSSDKTKSSEARSAEEPAPAEKQTAAAAPKTDPAMVAMMQRQEELMKTQNRLLQELSAKSGETNTEVIRERSGGVGIAPTVAVPVGGGSRADNSRIEKLEEEVAELKKKLESQAAAVNTIPVDSSEIYARPEVPIAASDVSTETDSLATDSLAVDSAQGDSESELIAEAQKRDSLNAAVEAIRQKADSISNANSAEAARREEAEKVAAAQKESAPESEPTAPKLTASYPAVFKFGLNKDDVGSDYDALFNKVAADLKANPEARASIVGYTDRSGNPDYNRQLSERRANSIKRRLTERGVPAEKLMIRAEGESAGDDKWNAGDRRVEVMISF